VVKRLRLVAAEQLRAAQAVEAAPAPTPAAVAGDLQLAQAADKGDWAAVARLLAAGADPNASVAMRTPSGESYQSTALCAAAVNGRLEAAQLLLEAGADPSLAGGSGTTPLMNAAGDGQLEVLAWAGCDVGLKTVHGETGRELAEAEGHTAVVERLRAMVTKQLRAAQAAARAAKQPEPVAGAGDGGPAQLLLVAALEGDAASVARLLGAGADPNASVHGQREYQGEVADYSAAGGGQ
jgi:ankyrin repeat protein